MYKDHGQDIPWLDSYSKTIGPTTDASTQLWDIAEQPVAEQIISSIPLNGTFLDLGCGAGTAAYYFATQRPDLSITGVDIGLVSDYTGNFVQADAHSLPFEDELFDIVWLSHTLEHVFCPFTVILEARRVLKPNGLLCILVPRQNPISCTYTAEPGHIWELGGHATLLYTLSLLGFDCQDASLWQCGYTAATLVKKAPTLPKSVFFIDGRLPDYFCTNEFSKCQPKQIDPITPVQHTTTKSIRRVGIVGGFGTHNIGDDLMLHVVSKAITERLPQATIWKLTYGCKYHQYDNHILSMRNNPTQCILDSELDLIVWGPGGLFPGVATVQNWCPEGVVDFEALGDIPHIGVGLGYFLQRGVYDLASEKEQDSYEATRKMLRHFKWLGVRDKFLAKLCEDAGIEYTIAPDLAYGYNPQLLPPCQETSDVVLVSPRYGHVPAVVTALTDMIHWLLELGWRVKLVPSQAALGDMDLLLCHDIQKAIPLVEVVEDVVSYEDFFHLLADCAALYSLSKHPSILANMMGVPVWIYDYRANIQQICGAETIHAVGNWHDPGDVESWRIPPNELVPPQLNDQHAQVHAMLASFLQALTV